MIVIVGLVLVLIGSGIGYRMGVLARQRITFAKSSKVLEEGDAQFFEPVSIREKFDNAKTVDEVLN